MSDDFDPYADPTVIALIVEQRKEPVELTARHAQRFVLTALAARKRFYANREET